VGVAVASCLEPSLEEGALEFGRGDMRIELDLVRVFSELVDAVRR
jgi:hypothetical protein